MQHNEWKDCVIDALVVNWAYKTEHEEDPRQALVALLISEQQYVLDPTISPEARALVQQGYEQGIKVACNSFRKVIGNMKSSVTETRGVKSVKSSAFKCVSPGDD
jgi:hypothetical protein